MSRARVIINGKVEMDGDFGAHIIRPPDFIAESIKPGVKPEPYMQAILIALSGAAKSEVDVSIIASTHENGGWSLRVEPCPG